MCEDRLCVSYAKMMVSSWIVFAAGVSPPNEARLFF